MANNFGGDFWITDSVDRVEKGERGRGDRENDKGRDVGSDLFEEGVVREGDTQSLPVSRVEKVEGDPQNGADE